MKTIYRRRLLARRRLSRRYPLAARGARRDAGRDRGVGVDDAWSHVDPNRTQAAMQRTDVSLPFGGVPIGVKQLTSVAGWPATGRQCRALKDRGRRARHDDGGAAPVRPNSARPSDDDRQRVRRYQPHDHEAPRRDAQPVGSRPNAGRVVRRYRGGRRRGRVHDRDRRRRRRIDPDPRRVHRAGRAEEHLRAHPEGSADGRRFAHGGFRLPREVGARRRPLPRRLQRLRPARPVQPPARRRLGARPRPPS